MEENKTRRLMETFVVNDCSIEATIARSLKEAGYQLDIELQEKPFSPPARVIKVYRVGD